MKAIETVKKLLSWGPTVVQQLERVAVIDERLPQIAAEQQAETSFVPVSEHAAEIVAWVRRQNTAGSPLFERGTAMMRLLGHPSPKDPAIVQLSDVAALLCLFLGPLMEQEAVRVVAAISAQTPPPRGRPAAERPPILARLAEERIALLAERADLVDAIREASAGTVMIQQLPETQHERDVAARVAEQAGINAEIQRAHKAGVPVGTPAAARSPFIQSGERGR